MQNYAAYIIAPWIESKQPSDSPNDAVSLDHHLMITILTPPSRFCSLYCVVRFHLVFPEPTVTMAKKKNHTNQNQNKKAHKNGIHKPKYHRFVSLKQVSSNADTYTRLDDCHCSN